MAPAALGRGEGTVGPDRLLSRLGIGRRDGRRRPGRHRPARAPPGGSLRRAVRTARLRRRGSRHGSRTRDRVRVACVPAGAQRGHRPLQLGGGLGRQVLLGGEHMGQGVERSRRSTPQLELELDEAIHHATRHATTATSSTESSTSADSSARVRVRRSWRIVTISSRGASPACSRTSARADDGWPGVRVEREARRTLELLAPVERRLRRRRRLDRDDGHCRTVPQPDRVACPSQRTVRGVEVAILDLDLAGATCRAEGTDRPQASRAASPRRRRRPGT